MPNTGKLIVFAVLLVAHFAAAQTRTHQNFDRDWKFGFGHAHHPEKDFNFGLETVFSKSGGAWQTAIEPRFNDSLWRSLHLPHDWAVALPFVNDPAFNVMAHGYKPLGGHYPETSIGWYRKHFSVAKPAEGRRFQLQFDGVFRDAQFWVNGFYLGNHKSGYIGISYDITDFLVFDKENVLVVRVDASQYEGWFYEGAGIYRHVWLNTYADTHPNADSAQSRNVDAAECAGYNIDIAAERDRARWPKCAAIKRVRCDSLQRIDDGAIGRN